MQVNIFAEMPEIPGTHSLNHYVNTQEGGRRGYLWIKIRSLQNPLDIKGKNTDAE